MRCFYLLYCLWVICCGFTEENTKDLLYKIREIKYRDPQMAVSYTHLTLPTILRV